MSTMACSHTVQPGLLGPSVGWIALRKRVGSCRSSFAMIGYACTDVRMYGCTDVRMRTNARQALKIVDGWRGGKRGLVFTVNGRVGEEVEAVRLDGVEAVVFAVV